MTTNFNINLKRKTLSVGRKKLSLDNSLYDSNISELDDDSERVLTLSYKSEAYEDMENIFDILQSNYPKEGIRVDGGEYDDKFEIAVYGDINAYIEPILKN